MDEKNFAEACPKLEESQRLDPAIGTLLNLATCFEGWGRTASAWARYSEAETQARRLGQAERAELAAERQRALDPELARLSIDVAPEAKLPGLVIKLDGVELNSAVFGVPVPVDPGEHVIDAVAPGKKPQRIGAQAVAREVRSVSLTAFEDQPVPSTPPPAVAPPTRVAPASPPAVDAGSGQTARTAGFVVGGFGVVALAAGTIFYVLTKSATDDAKALCTGGPGANECRDVQEEGIHQSNVDAAQLNQTLSYVSFGLGGAAVAAGIVLIATASPAKKATTARVAPLLGRREVGLSVTGAF